MINKDTYKRLTELKTYSNGKKMYVQYSVSGCYNDMNRKGDYTTGDSVDRLAELEDKIMDGRLVELPCKVGDKVYEVFKEHKPPFIQETTIEKIVITEKGFKLRLSRNSVYETAISSLGRTIFLTESEAKAKLKELQEKQK